jgi:hypothetical protein
MRATLIEIAREHETRTNRWHLAAALGLGLALCGILLGATGFSSRLPLPTWSLTASSLAGLLLSGLAGIRLMALRPRSSSDRPSTESGGGSGAWSEISHAFETFKSGRRPSLVVPDDGEDGQRVAFERANETFQFLARRQKVVRAALDELRGELSNYHRYLTKSQVGLIGANSVAERLEKFEERLAKIRSAV